MERFLLADGNSDLRSALALLLETRLGGQIVGQANTFAELLHIAQELKPDIIVLDSDLSGPRITHTERIQALRQTAPQSKILITSIRSEVGPVALAASADGFINKSDLPEAILAAFHLVLKHHV